MKNLIILFLIFSIMFITTPCMAVTVKSNTVIPISVSSNATSKNTISGGTIDAIIAEDVKVNNILVFKTGDNATINVLSTKKAGFIGIPGEMIISGGKVFDIKGNEHRFEYNQQIIGNEKTWAKVCLGVSIFFLWPLALVAFVKGGQAELAPIQVLNVKLTNDFDI